MQNTIYEFIPSKNTIKNIFKKGIVGDVVVFVFLYVETTRVLNDRFVEMLKRVQHDKGERVRNDKV